MTKKKKKPLYKTTIIIWSEFDPHENMELVDLAQEATDGMAYCTSMVRKLVKDPSKDKDWDGTEFFHDILDEE
jgi:hypothetical protein